MEGSGQIFEGPSMADADALGRHTLQHQRSNWTGHLKALQHKDDRDTPTDPGQPRYVSAIRSDTAFADRSAPSASGAEARCEFRECKRHFAE